MISLDEAPAALMAMDELGGGAGGLTVVALSGALIGRRYFRVMSLPSASDPTDPGANLSGPSEPGAADEDAFDDEVLEPEEDPGLHHVRSEHRGMPLRPDDDALEAAVERDRVAAGLADYAPVDVPAGDEPCPRARTRPSTWPSAACWATPR